MTGTDLIIAKVAELVTSHEGLIEKMEQRAMQAVVESGEAAQHCTDLIKAINKEKTAVEKARKEMVGPLNDQVSQINDAFRPLGASLDAAKKVLGNKLTDWQVAQEAVERKRREAERKAAEEAALAAAQRLEDEGKDDAASKVVDLATQATTKQTSNVEPIRGNLGTTSALVPVYTFEVVDKSLIHRNTWWSTNRW